MEFCSVKPDCLFGLTEVKSLLKDPVWFWFWTFVRYKRLFGLTGVRYKRILLYTCSNYNNYVLKFHVYVHMSHPFQCYLNCYFLPLSIPCKFYLFQPLLFLPDSFLFLIWVFYLIHFYLFPATRMHVLESLAEIGLFAESLLKKD